MNHDHSPITEVELLFDYSLDLLCYVGLQGQFSRVNNAFAQILGYTKKELVSKPILYFIAPQDQAATCGQLALLARNENVYDFKNRYRRSDGTYIWLSWNAFRLPDGTCFGSARDITSAELIKENLIKVNQQNEHRFLSLIESGDDIILILNAQGVYQFVSPSVRTIFQTDPAFYLGKITFQFIHPEDLEWVGSEFSAVMKTEVPLYIPPFRFQVGSGDWVWIETIATNRLSDPAIEGIVINAKDVTAKRKQEQEKVLITQQLELSNERYRLAIEATQDVIWDWDLKTDTLSWGKGFEKYFGKDSDAEQLKTDYWKAHFHPADKEKVIRNFQAAIADPEVRVWREEYRYLKAGGEIAFISDQGYIIRNSNKQAVRVVGAMHDITELKEKEQRIIKQNARLTEVALINSHELRRPVATILGLLDLLDVSSVPDQQNREVIERLETTAVELDAVIRRINERASAND